MYSIRESGSNVNTKLENVTHSQQFKRWFGDWRAHDTSQVKVVSQKSAERGTVRNADTGWDILVSRQVFKETQHHSSESVKNAVKYICHT